MNNGDNTNMLATLPASQTNSTLVIPLTNLRFGQVIETAFVIGQIDSAGNTATVKFDLRRISEATAGFTDASVADKSITVWADTELGYANTVPVLTPEAVAANTSYYLLITGTTEAGTDVEIAAACTKLQP